MDLLEPDWQQPRPTSTEVDEMMGRILLSPIALPAKPFTEFVSRLRDDRGNGGAHLAAFDVGQDRTLDWFVSRNRFSEVISDVVTHPMIRKSLSEVRIPASPPSPSTDDSGFQFFDPFLLQGTFANLLYSGGAYTLARGDGRAENQIALEVCESMFGLRYGEICCSPNYDQWTPWFRGIAWDVTIVVFDRRTRMMWILAVTDTD